MERPVPDLRLAANASWLVSPIPLESGLLPGPARRFESIENAVRFVMDDLDPAYRVFARITYDGGSLRIGDIARIHVMLPPKVK